MFHFATDEDHCNKPQLVKIQIPKKNKITLSSCILELMGVGIKIIGKRSVKLASLRKLINRPCHLVYQAQQKEGITKL